MQERGPLKVFGMFEALPVGRALSGVLEQTLREAAADVLSELALEVLMPEFLTPIERVGPVYWFKKALKRIALESAQLDLS